MYNIAYYPRVQGTLGLLVKVNGKHICGSPFNVTIKEFHGKPVSCFGRQGSGNGMFQCARGVAVTDGDEIVVAHDAGVQVFDSNGNFLRFFALQSYSYPFGVAITKERTIFLSEYGNHRVQLFSWEGRHLSSFGSKGNLDSKLMNPRGLSLDSNGNVIVADTGNKLIKIFTPDGRFLMKIGGQGSLSDPIHCVQCGEYLIVSDEGENCIKVFNREGHFQYRFGKQGQGDGEFSCPYFLSVTQSKHLLVCDQNNHRVQVFDVDGKFVGKFGSNGSKLGEFNGPCSVAVLSNDQIVVSDSKNNRIQIFK